MKAYSDFLSLISSEFHKYLMEHEEIVDKIPSGALVIFHVDNDDDFNNWNAKIALKNREINQQVVYVTVKKWRTQSAIEKVSIKRELV